MYRYLSALSVIVLVATLIGVGLSFQIPSVTSGSVAVVKEKIRAFSYQSLIPATFTTTDTKEYSQMVFVGDVLLARNVEFLMKKHGNDYPYQGVDLPAFGTETAVVGNFEAAIPVVHEPTETGMIDFSVATSTIPALLAAGYTHMSLGNNHSFDFGEDAFVHTQQQLDAVIETFGHPKELDTRSISYITLSGTKTALIGINALQSVSDDELGALFARAKARSTLQIVYVHWGEEYALRHNSQQRKLAEQYIELGADLIIGHHPHVVQGIDVIDSVPVFYSLGNYIFDQYFSKDVQEGLVVSLSYDNGFLIHLVPVTSKHSLSQPQPMDVDDHARFLHSVANRSTAAIESQIETGVLDMRTVVESSEKVAIMHDTFEYVQ